MPSAADLIDLFPHPELTPIGDDNSPPSYTTIQTLQTEINANLSAIASHLAEGQHGYAFLT
jgi:hypothetical protein